MSKRVVLITGGAQGIGEAIVRSFVQAGEQVVFIDVNEEKGLSLLAQLREMSGHAHFICADVAKADDVKRVIKEIETKFGNLHVLINNAGVSWFHPLEEIEIETFDRILAINLRGPFLLAKFAAPLIKKSVQQNGEGAIINIASTRALMSEPHNEAYAASKGGLLALTHALANSLGPAIRVNAICPGWIDTTGGKDIRPEDHSQHPVGRVGTPCDIAEACRFLASEAAGFITGQKIVIDGGMTIKMQYVE
jgi:NAD(P)-dependent dehydrogenase (short-subunit alcohol dehydrogenase family)